LARGKAALQKKRRGRGDPKPRFPPSAGGLGGAFYNPFFFFFSQAPGPRPFSLGGKNCWATKTHPPLNGANNNSLSAPKRGAGPGRGSAATEDALGFPASYIFFRGAGWPSFLHKSGPEAAPFFFVGRAKIPAFPGRRPQGETGVSPPGWTLLGPEFFPQKKVACGLSIQP